MDNFGFSNQIDLDGSPNHLPGDVYLELRNALDNNPPDKDWRALVRAVEKKYYIRPHVAESWSKAINTSDSPAGKLLSELACQGITVQELADYLDGLSIDTYPFGLRAFEEIVVHSEPGDSKEVDTGDTLFLEIEATGHPYPRYQWFFCPDGGEYEPLEGRNERVLRIENVTKNNAGCYSCQIHNCDDPEKTKLTGHTVVCVNTPPVEDEKVPMYWDNSDILNDRSTQGSSVFGEAGKLPLGEGNVNGFNQLIIQQPLDVDVEMNAPFVLEVGTQGRPPIHYQWFKNGEMMCGQSRNVIQVLHAMPEDFGDYYCTVQDGFGVTEKSRVVTVKKWPPLDQSENRDMPRNEIIFISQPKSCTVKFGGDAMFHCEAKCNAPLQYKWFKDGKPMDDQTEPEIKFINIQDRLCAGMYQCYVYQKGGNISDAMLSAPALLMIEVPAVNENIEYNPSDKVALLIGNNDYRCEDSLKAPPNDVLVLTESFRNLNFKVVSLLNLSKREIYAAVKHFCKLIGRNVYVVFYFCGHGFEEDGCSFLVPTDAVHGYTLNDCVCVESILESIQKKSPALICMILDICRKMNRVKGNGLPSSIVQRVGRGNTVFCYATSQGLNAYEDSKNGLLVKYLQPLLHQKLGIDTLWSNLKEDFHLNRDPRHTKIQLPELRSNIIEPRRSLADKISYHGETEVFHKRSKIWREAHITPAKRLIPFRDIGVVIELDFQSSFSNLLDIYVIVRNKGITRDCVAFLNSWPPQVSLISKNSLTGVACPTRKFTFSDIQKLQGDLLISLGVQYQLRNDCQDRLSCVYLNLGQPLVAKLELWRPEEGFTSGREAIEQNENDSLN